jgi:hypothetical protein
MQVQKKVMRCAAAGIAAGAIALTLGAALANAAPVNAPAVPGNGSNGLTAGNGVARTAGAPDSPRVSIGDFQSGSAGVAVAGCGRWDCI